MEANVTEEFRASLLRKLQDVIEREDTHVVILADDGSNRYVQFAEGRGEVRAEAVGNGYLADGFKLNES